jgi:hypothetical protein
VPVVYGPAAIRHRPAFLYFLIPTA